MNEIKIPDMGETFEISGPDAWAMYQQLPVIIDKEWYGWGTPAMHELTIMRDCPGLTELNLRISDRCRERRTRVFSISPETVDTIRVRAVIAAGGDVPGFMGSFGLRRDLTGFRGRLPDKFYGTEAPLGKCALPDKHLAMSLHLCLDGPESDRLKISRTEFGVDSVIDHFETLRRCSTQIQ